MARLESLRDAGVGAIRAGEARRCHFLPTRLGNIYDPGFEAALQPRACPAAACRCHIGYAHMPGLGYRELFGAGFLERALPMR